MTTCYDAIIVGTGQSDPSLSARLAGAGWRVAVIERKREVLDEGCIDDELGTNRNKKHDDAPI